jgi:hypothetical protein
VNGLLPKLLLIATLIVVSNATCVTRQNYIVNTFASTNNSLKVQFISVRTRSGWYGVSLATNTQSVMVVAFQNDTGSFIYEVNTTSHRLRHEMDIIAMERE